MKLRNERGAELVEFALASTIFFIGLFGAISAGISIYRYNMLANLAQEGARYGIVRGSTANAAMKAQGTAAQVQSFLQARNPGVPITVTTNADPKTLSAGDDFRVTVSSTVVRASAYSPWPAFGISASSQMTMAR